MTARQPESGLGRVDRSWMKRAHCRGVDPNLFHPGSHVDQQEPKAVCSGCQVKQECLDYALTVNEKYGIWGGLNERERKRLRRRQTAA